MVGSHYRSYTLPGSNVTGEDSGGSSAPPSERKVVGVRRLITLLAVVGAMLVLYAGGVLAQEAPQDRGAEPYIVVFKGETVAKPGQAASAMARRDNLEVGFVYRHALEGFSAVIPQTKLDEVRADSRVKYIERDGKMDAFA